MTWRQNLGDTIRTSLRLLGLSALWLNIFLVLIWSIWFTAKVLWKARNWLNEVWFI